MRYAQKAPEHCIGLNNADESLSFSPPNELVSIDAAVQFSIRI